MPTHAPWMRVHGAREELGLTPQVRVDLVKQAVITRYVMASVKVEVEAIATPAGWRLTTQAEREEKKHTEVVASSS